MVGLYVYMTILYCRLYGDVLRVVGGMVCRAPVLVVQVDRVGWIRVDRVQVPGSCRVDRVPGRVQASGSCSGIRSGSSVLPDQLLPGSCYLDRPVLLHGSGRQVRKKSIE